MISQNLIDYLYAYILKKEEKLDIYHISTTNQFIDIPIIKSTKRTYRQLGFLTIGNTELDGFERDLDPSLLDLKFTPRKKLPLTDNNSQTLKWLEEGWIIKEIRFKQDGKSLHSQYYRMGYRLYNHQLKLEKHRVKQLTNELTILKDECCNVIIPPEFPYLKRKMVENLKEKLIPLCDINSLTESKLFQKSWSLKKRIKFLHFILAVLQIATSKQQFDWKEIGALYYQSIGGSKKFDNNQAEFLRHLEQWSGYPAIELGLTSLGHITPVFFSGALTGRFSSYDYGPVHAVTNLSLDIDRYTTEATTLWIVENRGILTHITSQKGFLAEEAVLMVCCDGHVRSTHRLFIEQIIQSSNLAQVIIWTDYDQDGMMIAQELYNIVKQVAPAIKWISPSGEILQNWVHYEKEMLKFLQSNTMEQEEMTGDVTRWKEWIKN